MIFHCPFPLDPDATAASGIRPVRMAQAFENLGYDVFLLTGYGKERSARYKELKRRILAGERFEFLYSESSTKPLSLTEPNNLPRYPFLDHKILRFVKRHAIPAGMFYRDVYWRYPEYMESVSRFKGNFARVFYRLDLQVLDQELHTIFLPSLRMLSELPEFKKERVAALPPASPVIDSATPDHGISLFYVGGLGPYYQLHECIRAVTATPGARLTICTPQNNWELHKSEYEPLMDDSVEVVHARGAELKQYFNDAHLGVLFLKPIEYREFAAPLKFYEYLAHGKPVLSSTGTLVGDQVEQEDVGWSLPYEAEALGTLLTELLDAPDVLSNKVQNVARFAEQNTWEARAQQAADRLTR